MDSPINPVFARRSRKGQGAFEFLTTYGWAFLIILVVIAALVYFRVFNPSRNLPDKCTFGQIFTCTDMVVHANPSPGEVRVVLAQNKGATVFVKGMSVEMQDFGGNGLCKANGVDLDGVAEVRMESNDRVEIVCPLQAAALKLSDFVGDKESAQLVITYRELRSTFNHTEAGSLYTTVFT
jgi:hypothetical protein